jgi:hypothetical protein
LPGFYQPFVLQAPIRFPIEPGSQNQYNQRGIIRLNIGRLAMKENAISDKALSLLVHPISLAAIGIYSLNTFVLQRITPNWFTGKLGDFAWVFVVPLALTAILSWLLPERHRKVAFTFSILGTGVIFILIKATSLNTWLSSNLTNLIGSPISVVQDKSDLLALLVLPVTLWLWVRPRVILKTRRLSGVILIAIFTLFTVADSAAPNIGITSIEFVDNTIVGCNPYYSSVQSNDGGQTWQNSQHECKERIYSPKYGEIIQDPNNGKIQYKFEPGLIERSIDGGNTWQGDYQWNPPSEAERMYYIASNHAYLSGDRPPFSGAVDPQTGDVFFAMGHEGILKRASGTDPKYSWIASGEYIKISYQKSELLINLLYGEWMLVLCAGSAGVALLDIKLKPGKAKTAFLILGLIGMAICVVFFPPAPTLTQPYLSQFLPLGLLIVLLLMLSLAANALYNAGMNSKRRLLFSIIGFLTISILSFVPFAFWIYNILPHYQIAMITAVIVAAVGIFGLQFIASKGIPAETPKMNG